ncbi:transposase [Pontibacter aydingkolensis]|uniref:Transposase n=1 Tax=Pontibacter aydingkolensis TaxID=1911536 RepID=A0ABS7CZP4_9BACT|nr:transposase [Pontibacter aydingkolensis]MBW7469309.1 transposase [Pontibacter aydingkolensis]
MSYLPKAWTTAAKNKGMGIYAWCIMPRNVHLIFRAQYKNPSVLLKELKTYTSKQLQKAITKCKQERKGKNRMDAVADGAGRPKEQQREAPAVLAATQQAHRTVGHCRDRP